MRINIGNVDTEFMRDTLQKMSACCSDMEDLLGDIGLSSRLERDMGEMEPRISNTTVTVGRIVRLLFVEEWSLEEVLHCHTGLCEDDVRAAMSYAGIEWDRVSRNSTAEDEPDGNRETAQGCRGQARRPEVDDNHGVLGQGDYYDRGGYAAVSEEFRRKVWTA